MKTVLSEKFRLQQFLESSREKRMAGALMRVETRSADSRRMEVLSTRLMVDTDLELDQSGSSIQVT